MKIISAIVLVLLLNGCSGESKINSQKPDKSLNATWIAEYINGISITSDSETGPEKLPQLEINMEELKYTGNDGCNNIFGGITELDQEILVFGMGAGTRMMCQNMEIPDLFNQTLPRVASYKIKKNKLHLFDKEGNELMQFKLNL